MYKHPVVAKQAVFRGGTALHKLFFEPAGRYSEDIDLVQREAGPIGGLIDAIREVLDPWLGKPKWKQGSSRTRSFEYRLSKEQKLAHESKNPTMNHCIWHPGRRI